MKKNIPLSKFQITLNGLFHKYGDLPVAVYNGSNPDKSFSLIVQNGMIIIILDEDMQNFTKKAG